MEMKNTKEERCGGYFWKLNVAVNKGYVIFMWGGSWSMTECHYHSEGLLQKTENDPKIQKQEKQQQQLKKIA